MHDGWRGECSKRLIRLLIPNPRGQGHRHEHQACQRRSSGAGDDVKVLPGGKRQHRSLLHDESPFDVYVHFYTTIRQRKLGNYWHAMIWCDEWHML